MKLLITFLLFFIAAPQFIIANAQTPTYLGNSPLTCSQTALSTSLPANIQTNDILLMFVETGNQTITVLNQNGGTWAQTPDSFQGTGSGGTRLTAFWSRYNGVQGAPVLSDSGNHQCSTIIAIRGVENMGNPWDVTSGGINSSGPNTLSISGDETTGNDRLVVIAVADDWDSASTDRYTGWSNLDLANITEQVDIGSTIGNGGGIGIATAEKSAAGVFGQTSVNQATSITKNGFISIALKPPTPRLEVFDQTAFRIKGDDTSGLNSQDGWAADINTNTSVVPDKEFRIRFEVNQSMASPSSTFELWYSKDNGPYTKVSSNAIPWSAKSLEGQKSVMAVPSASYTDLDETINILESDGSQFFPGVGNEDNLTPVLNFSNPSHTELEWTLIIRKLYDAKGHNADGSTFDFRVFQSEGVPLTNYSNTPRVTLLNRPGHIGGTVVETPMRYHTVDSSGNLYYLSEYSETGNTAVMMKSSDGGTSWNPMDVSGEPTGTDLEAADIDLRGDTIYIAVQGPGSGDSVQHWRFNTSTHPTNPDNWELIDETVSVVSPSEQCTAISQRADSTVIAYCGNASGSDQRLYYKIRSTTWGSDVALDATVKTDFEGIGIARDSTDKVHFVYIGHDGVSYKLYLKTLSATDTLNQRSVIADTGIKSYGAANRTNLTPPIVWLDNQTEKIGVAYRKLDNKLYFKSWDAQSESLDSEQLISDRTVEWNEGDNSLIIADVSIDNETGNLHAIYSERTLMDLWIDVRTLSVWGLDQEIKDSVSAQWVRSSIFTQNLENGGAKVFGYIWDDGSFGGTGRTRYDQVSL